MMAGNEVSPAAGATANGARNAKEFVSPRPTHPNAVRPQSATSRMKVTFRLSPDAEPMTVVGREAQTLLLLAERGPLGFTSGEASPLKWGRRTSAYIHKLRRLGVHIETARETTSDGACIGRYSLTSPVELLEVAA